MRILNSFLMTAVVTVSVSVGAQADQGSGYYLGNRDDVVIMQPRKVMNKQVESVATKQIETVKQDASEMAVRVSEKVSEPVKTIKMDNTSSTVMASSSMASAPATPAYSSRSAAGDVPPNARPGECYAKVLIPGRYESETKRIKVSDEQRVLKRIIPAKYETTTERIKIKDARKYWKAGHGPITKTNQVTGEILCLVEEPAEYKTIEKRVLVQPEQPEYKTMPARFESVTKKRMIQEESWEWRRILCETNLTSSSVKQIQQALASKGYGVKVDGRLGEGTLSAINRYQLKNNLASRGITYETLNHLGVSLAGV